MLLRNLPEDILAIVLGKCAASKYDTTQRLKHTLPLLAVCQLWRRLAAPLVYNHVFVQYGDQPKRRAGQTIRSPDAEEPADVVVKSNLDLVAMVGCANAVRQVQIDVHCSANPLPEWREVIQRMRAAASKWRVVELKLWLHPDSGPFDDNNVDMAKHTDGIAEVSDALAALMPDLRRLLCMGNSYNPIARSLYGRLASHYADQLERLSSTHAITVPADCRFMRLRQVAVNYDHMAGHQLPQMASGELVDVSLTHGQPDHSWASFSADGDSRVIEFPKLKSLHTGCFTATWEDRVAARHRRGPRWELHFPSLRRLLIYCTHGVCPLLKYAVLPPRMEFISIKLESAAFQQHANLVLPATRHLSLCIDSESRGDPSGLPTINRILEDARGSEVLGLAIEDEMLPVLPESITCTNLTQMLIAARTSVDTMLALIKKLPKLTRLCFYDVDLSDVQTDVSVPAADMGAAVEPLSLSLVELAINLNTRRHSPDMAVAVAVVKYMLLGIPTLIKLYAVQTPEGPVLSFVEEYAPRYLHLSSVELKLDEGGGGTYMRCSFQV